MNRPTAMRVLIVRLGALGDIVHTVPLAAALRRRLPGSAIDWVVEERYAGLLDMVPGLDRRIVLRTRSRPTLSAWWELRRTLRAVSYDVALDVQGLGKSALVARLSGARRVVGFSAPFLRERWARWLHTETADPGRGRHVVDRNLGILGALGGGRPRVVLSLQAPGAARGRRAAGRLRRPRPQRRVGDQALAPGALRGGRRARGPRARPVLRVIWGPDDRARAGAVVAASGGAAALAPPTDLAELASLLQAAALLVSGDTGPLHLAAALGTPVVGLYGPSDPARNGPWSSADEVVSAFPDCTCAAWRAEAGRPVPMVRRCRAGKACLEALTADRVCAAVDRRLGSTWEQHA